MWGVVTSTGLALSTLATLRTRLSDAFLGSSWATQQGEPAGQLQSLAGLASAGVGVLQSFSSIIAAGLNLAALVAVSVVVDPFATIVVVAAVGVLGSVLGPLRSRIRAHAKITVDAGIQYNTALSELSSLGLEMQTYGVRPAFAHRLAHFSGHETFVRRRANVLQGMVTPVYTTLAYSALLVGLGAAALVGVGELSTLGAVMLVMMRSLSYGQQLQSASVGLVSSIPSIERLDEVLIRYDANAATNGHVVVSSVGQVSAKALAFAYLDDQPVLKELTFLIKTGEVVGVVGPSGAGKSTLVQLLLGLREPTSGAIEIDGINLRDVDRASWNSRVAFVAQDATLFTGTVADNIRFFRSTVSDSDLRDAATQANLLNEIEHLPDGFDTFLGERGTRLSGGQRQRLSIARALAGRPEFLILDEPTSALDSHSEALIRDTIASLRSKVTVVIIAHRMSTIDMCDRIIVIEQGQMTAFETPEVLRSTSGFYRLALERSGMT
ncbi:unannotated protein [freshwater metagenome]|uniref:Unannotated protein n=1 Tax=freshwater metagenome TaxID=449393 RepID=A0A6J7AUB3_9ZZZZ